MYNPDFPDEMIDEFVCPRCGAVQNNVSVSSLAESRYCDESICTECGTDEAMRQMSGNVLPVSAWVSRQR